VLQAQECLKLPSMIANVISVIAAAIITIPMIKPFAKHLKINTPNY
jgi:maltodextrin utilization protein YvdJ